VKRSDAKLAASLQLTIAGQVLNPVQVDGSWDEFRFVLPPGKLRAGHVPARITSSDPSARFAVDHLLLLPRSSEVFAQRTP
jgi:hypothetical protein